LSKHKSVATWLRIVAMTALALWTIHRWLAPVCPADFPWFRVNAAMMGLVILPATLSFLSLFFRAFNTGNTGL
jgi:hypothetical protein